MRNLVIREVDALPRITQQGFNRGLSGFIAHALNTLVICFEQCASVDPSGGPQKYSGIEITILWEISRKQGLVVQTFPQPEQKRASVIVLGSGPQSLAFTEASGASDLSHPQGQSYPEAVLSRHLGPTVWLAVSPLNTRPTPTFSRLGDLLDGRQRPHLAWVAMAVLDGLVSEDSAECLCSLLPLPAVSAT